MLHVIEDDEEWNKVAEIASERLFYEEKSVGRRQKLATAPVLGNVDAQG